MGDLHEIVVGRSFFVRNTPGRPVMKKRLGDDFPVISPAYITT